jgi:hypothetical protein
VGPVERGDAPVGPTTYEEMSPTLFDRLGKYCSYCEFPVVHVPHAEHIVPKKRFTAHRNLWTNLLVACSYCNAKKGHQRPPPEDVDAYLWPTRDNTSRAFEYPSGVPRVAAGVMEPARTMAAKLRGLVQLAVTSDARWKERAAVFAQAEGYRAKLTSAPDPTLLREALVDLAVAKGFFSVWMEVFAGDVPLRRALIKAFTGTASSCFSASTSPIERPGGRW